ncbi:11237_t:CDS:2 [Dentiscutata erythropus]|uniref:11237_t:CDS:1 n=1 Tax=Dentiscutata erythropus TaxID=1348616 RepID=A0A9N9BSP5_9GLOM|nr:11237_t:CDS:2 [Dentiscutata erythropus]
MKDFMILVVYWIGSVLHCYLLLPLEVHSAGPELASLSTRVAKAGLALETGVCIHLDTWVWVIGALH